MRTLDYGVDVVVGTPGRIIDLIKRGALHLKDVQFVVLDEADQMLAVGFEEAVETILQNLPSNRQSFMFSATMPQAIRSLTRKYLKDPVTIDLVSTLFSSGYYFYCSFFVCLWLVKMLFLIARETRGFSIRVVLCNKPATVSICC